jgi:hypothetical protein
MALDPVVNFFRSEIATLPLASGTTTMVITTGDGNKLPDPDTDGAFNLTIYNADDPFVTPEIVRCTAKSGDSLTITRAQEGTTATNKTTGSTWYVELVPTAKTIQDIDDKKLDVAGGTMTGDLTIPDKIIHAGDTNTAIRFPSDDTVTVETGGSEAMRVDSSQNVMVGATSGTMRFNVQNKGIVGGTERNPNASGTTVSIYTITCTASSDSLRYNIANGVLKVSIGSRSTSHNAVATYTLPFMLSRIGRNTGIVVLTQGTPTLLTASTSSAGLDIDTVTVALSSASNTGATLDITVTTSGAQAATQLDFNSSLEITQQSRLIAPFTIVPA